MLAANRQSNQKEEEEAPETLLLEASCACAVSKEEVNTSVARLFPRAADRVSGSNKKHKHNPGYCACLEPGPAQTGVGLGLVLESLGSRGRAGSGPGKDQGLALLKSTRRILLPLHRNQNLLLGSSLVPVLRPCGPPPSSDSSHVHKHVPDEVQVAPVIWSSEDRTRPGLVAWTVR